MLAISARIIATCFALVGFAASCIVGVGQGNNASAVLGRSILVMLLCYVVGRLVGSISQRTVDEHIAKVKQENPIPDEHAVSMSDASTDQSQQAGQTQAASAS